MKKIKKIAIYATTIALVTAGSTFHICRENITEYENYITSYSESIVEDDFLITAHRGFSSLEVENTKEAISLASEKDYIDYIEIDARLTKDGKIILSHNNQLLTMDFQISTVSSLSYEQLKQTLFCYQTFPLQHFSLWDVESGMNFERKCHLYHQSYQLPSLLEGLSYCQDKKVLLDLKFNDDIPEFVEELQRELDGVDTSHVIFQSLDINGIRYLQEKTNYDCLALISNTTNLQYMDDFQRVGIKYSLINRSMVQELLDEGKMVALWTINDTASLDRVVNILGDSYQDVIYITDYPDLIATKLNEREQVKSLKYVSNS